MSQFVDDDRVMPRFRVDRQAMVDPWLFAKEGELILCRDASYQELPWSDISRGRSNPVPEGNEELQVRARWRRRNELITGEVLPDEITTPRRPPSRPHGRTSATNRV
jgi:hypothetical protein